MSPRALPARPHLDHLKREAKALLRAHRAGDVDATERVEAVLGTRPQLKATEAQRVVAREYGFRSWAALRAHVQTVRGVGEATDAFLAAIGRRDRVGATDVLRKEPRIARTSLHVAAALGLDPEVRRLIAEDASRVSARAGTPSGEPLLWLSHSPFHGESPERDEGLAASARALLDAGADPNTRDGRYGVPALYAVTGLNNAPGIARILLDAGAEPTDGESVFHAAEHFHVEALDLLLAYGVELNRVGDWGNTPLYFLLRYWDVAGNPTVEQGVRWLLDHGADPDVRCGTERETSLHVAVRRGQAPRIVRLLLEHGADVHSARGDGRTPWRLARRGGHDVLASVLEEAGAVPEPLSPLDELLAACGRGDADAARRLSSPGLVSSMSHAELMLLPESASRGRPDVAIACVAAGLPVDATDEQGATALHHAAIHGQAALVRALVDHGADLRLQDNEHESPPLGWACFGADYISDPDGDYEATVRALLQAGAPVAPGYRPPEHAGVRRALREHGSGPTSPPGGQ